MERRSDLPTIGKKEENNIATATFRGQIMRQKSGDGERGGWKRGGKVVVSGAK
jgi:hypothetical protein